MIIRLPFERSAQAKSAQAEYQSGLACLNNHRARRALRHFKSAVMKEPKLAVDAADACLGAQRPKLAVKLLDEGKRAMKSPFDLAFQARRTAAYGEAHHALVHATFGRFSATHNWAEIGYLKNVVSTHALAELDIPRRYSLALAERYSHQILGECYQKWKQKDHEPTTPNKGASLFVQLIQATSFQLTRGDSRALEIIEQLSLCGPSELKFPEVAAARIVLIEALESFLGSAEEPEAERANALLRALSSRKKSATCS